MITLPSTYYCINTNNTPSNNYSIQLMNQVFTNTILTQNV